MKSKVLFIMHMPPPVHGAAMMGKYIHDSRYVNESFDCHYINLATAKNLQDIGKVGIQKLLDSYHLLRKIRAEVKRLRPELVYVTPNACGGAFYKDFIVVRMLKRMGCRVVVHYHNKGVSTRQDRWIDNCLYKRFFKGLKVILLAETLYRDVAKYVGRDDVFICPNGIPETLSQEPEATRQNNIPHFLFLSNLLESKGVLVLLDACKILKERGYGFVCNFVGGETAEIDAKRFAREAESRELKRITVYQGRKYGTDKWSCFEESDVFVFPTYYHNECFPLVLLEAMQHKVPCISTDEGGIRNIVKDGENGLIVPCRRKGTDSEGPSVTELADALEYFIKNPILRHRMGENGYRTFKKHFTLQAFERKFVEGLEWALGR